MEGTERPRDDRSRTPSAWNLQSQVTHERIASVVLDVNMDMRDQAVLNKILKENTDYAIRRNLTKKFNLYYGLWLDFCILTSGLAAAGLVIGIYEWEKNYPDRGDEGQLLASNVFTQWIIAITTMMGELAIIIKYRLEATWRHFDNPIKFYRKIVRQ